MSKWETALIKVNQERTIRNKYRLITCPLTMWKILTT